MDNNKIKDLQEKLISLCKRRGFIFQGSEIYGGLAGTWDYGPLGVALKNNIQNLWWKRFVLDREDMYGMDAAILMNQNVWKASGHVGGFSDPLVECENKNCKNRRHRVDQLINEKEHKIVLERLANLEKTNEIIVDVREGVLKTLGEGIKEGFAGEIGLNAAIGAYDRIKQFREYTGVITQVFLNENKIKCPSCGEVKWGVPKRFNMMLQTHIGAIQDDSSVSYLRPETAGGMFVNFKNIVDSLHPKLPFGMAQIGKAFRNEIAPRDFIFRVRELEQMEIEYFIHPTTWEENFESFRKEVWEYTKDVGLSQDKVHELEVGDGDRAHYSKRTIDFEFDFPFGRKELYGLAYRGDFDLNAHQKESKVDLTYFDEEKKERFLPHVIEPSFGVGRTLLAVLADAYTEDNLGGEVRSFLKLSPKVAPFLVAVFPLLKNKPELVAKAREVYNEIRKAFPGRVMFDDNGNIGKRYRRQDEIGTPYCVTVDFDTLEKDLASGGGVTLRNRDTGDQERMSVEQIIFKIKESL